MGDNDERIVRIFIKELTGEYSIVGTQNSSVLERTIYQNSTNPYEIKY